MRWKHLFRSSVIVPQEHRANFRHLYFDMAWFGVLNGSFIAFSAVYLTRIGASATQLGWFTAIPAIVALLLSLPAGFWLKNKKLDRMVFWSAAWFRFYYLIWLLLLFFVPQIFQVNLILFLTIVLSVPGTILAIGFNSLFAAIVPPTWRNHVIGVRQALLAITSVISTLACGYMLDMLPFLTGYKIVFGIAAAAGIMSSFHLWFIDDRTKPVTPFNTGKPLRESARPGLFAIGSTIRPPMGFRYLRRREHLRLPRFNVLNGDFGRAMAVIFFMFLALYIANPLYYPYWVDQLGYSDMLISVGAALFYLFQFLTAIQLPKIARQFGDQKALALGAALLSAYPGITAISPHPAAYILSSVVSGVGWGIAGGAILAYLLAIVPEDERPRYIAWYSLLTNLAILTGSLLGPIVGGWLGLRMGLGVAAILRLTSGLLIWYFGYVTTIVQQYPERQPLL